MATPTIVTASPPDGSTGVLLQEKVEVIFDQEMDEDALEQGGLVLATTAYRVLKTGPAPIDYEDYLSPDTMSTSGFRGFVTGAVTCEKINLLDTDSYTGSDDATGSRDLYRTKVTFTPSQDLEASKSYNVLLGTTVQNRTIFEVVKSGSGTGTITTKGPYLGTVDDTYTITVTAAGARQSAKFRWTRVSDGYVSAEMTASRFFKSFETSTDVGIRIKFEKGTFETGDTFAFVVKPGESLENIYAWGFSTGLVSADVPTTEAEDITSAEILSTVSMEPDSASTDFYVVSVTPEHGAGNQPVTTDSIVFKFSSDIDASTITEDSISIVGVSVDNIWNKVWEDDTSQDFPAAGAIEFSTEVVGSRLYISLNYGGSGGNLPRNNEIQVYLTDEITSADGYSLDNYMYYFTTRYDPIYLDIFQIKAKIGSYLGDEFPDDIIYRLILRYSKISDMMSNDITYLDTTTWYLIRSEWILCNVMADLLNNLRILYGGGDRKRLGDLSISYSSSDLGKINSAWADALDCIKRMEESMRQSTVNTVAVAVKGCRDPENPNFGRSITGYNESGLPYVNTSWVVALSAGYYTSPRLSRKILGNLRRSYNSNGVS